MPDSTVVVTQGSGTAVQYGTPNVSGLYTPQHLDRNSLTANATAVSPSYSRTGFQLIYQPVASGALPRAPGDEQIGGGQLYVAAAGLLHYFVTGPVGDVFV